MTSIFLIEKFSSIQGEGVLVGTPALFLRLARCNLRCPWCDTKYSWEGGREVKVDDLAKEIIEASLPLVVITGGEPLLQQRGVREIIEKSIELGYDGIFQIETNATIEPKLLKGLKNTKITLSPKITKDYNVASPSFVSKLLREYGEMVLELKLVVRASELDQVKEFLSKLGEVSVPIILQPLYEGNYEEEARKFVIRVLKDKELSRRTRVIPQLHKFLKID